MICTQYDSPIGKMWLCSDGTHLTAVVFDGQKHEAHHIPRDVSFGTCPVLEETRLWLRQYFSGCIPMALPPMKPAGTPFQQAVWKQLLEIPYGQTVTYGALADRIGCRSAQAVGGAVGRNPISILIPCHRVVGAGKSLIGYAAGLEKKESLLKLEKDHLS